MVCVCVCACHRVLDFFKTNVKSVRQYDRAQVLARMPFDLRSTILQHMYDTCIKVKYGHTRAHIQGSREHAQARSFPFFVQLSSTQNAMHGFV